MNIIKFSICIIASLQLLTSCNDTNKTGNTPAIDSTKIIDSIKVRNDFKSRLTDRSIPNTSVHISLPPEYSVRKIEDGVDFITYYFSHTDTTFKDKFSGTLRLGGKAPESKPHNDSCKNWREFGIVMERKISWDVYNCNDKYYYQVTVESQKQSDSFKEVHISGYAKSEIERNNLLDVFETIRQK